MADAIVVGSGLFGSVIAAELRSQGRRVIVLDDSRPDAGSRPAACLMKPSWFSRLGREVYEPALHLLDRHFGVMDLRFRVGPARTTVHWCNPRVIMREPPTRAAVTCVRPGADGGWAVGVRALEGNLQHAALKAPLVVVAAGVWSAQLAPVEGGLRSQAGLALLWPQERLEEPFIRPWAPYRQLVAFNRGDGLWCGDGSAIKEENWGHERERQSTQRITGAAGHAEDSATRLFGLRPYSKMKPCYLKEEAPGLWVATGGAKNGTLAAGWCAHYIGGHS